MARLKRIDRYPAEFPELFHAAATGDMTSVELEDANAARSLRNELYNYRKVLSQQIDNESLKLYFLIQDVGLFLDGNLLTLRSKSQWNLTPKKDNEYVGTKTS